MSPKILFEKNKERENRKREEKERKRRKKVMALSFYVDFFGEFLKEKDCLGEEVYFGCKKSSSNIYKFFLPLWLTEIW